MRKRRGEGSKHRIRKHVMGEQSTKMDLRSFLVPWGPEDRIPQRMTQIDIWMASLHCVETWSLAHLAEASFNYRSSIRTRARPLPKRWRRAKGTKCFRRRGPHPDITSETMLLPANTSATSSKQLAPARYVMSNLTTSNPARGRPPDGFGEKERLACNFDCSVA